ncbi:MAG: aldehyde reductase, partial [Cyanobacteria bacterium J06638_38]
GASGFIGGHCILALLKQGYAVRGTVRSKSQIEKCQALINDHYADHADVEYAIATLDSDD